MSNTLTELYVSDVISLAKTLVIKSVATAEAMNNSLTELNVPVSSDPTTWRYYKNIAGEYHSTDTTMTVISQDSLEEIPFTVTSLQDNRATRKAYAYGTSFYEALVNQYPRQELLIRGILNPLDKATAIAAKDNTILYYDSSLVEPTETNLIPGLQQWTDAFFLRWAHPAYQEVDDLYRASVLATYFAHLPAAIMNLRLQNCKTEFAHSYHIWTYLESNGHLGEYQDYFTTKQALWLYRNVKYLQMNAGRVKNQGILIDHVMTERGLPVGSYQMVHDITNFETGQSLYPEIALNKISRNERDAQSGGKTSHTVLNMLSRESKLARDNAKEIDLDEVIITEQMQPSLANNLPTKILESSMIDSSAGDVYPFAQIALNEWLHKATTGYYRAKIQVTNPYTGALMSMSATEAFVTWLYLVNKTYGITMDTIPDVVAWRVRFTPLPTFAELREITLPQYVGDNELQWVLENQATVGVMLSTEAFYETILEIHRYATNQYFMYSMHEDLNARGHCEAAVERCYQTVNCVLDSKHSAFEDYFKERGWYIVDLDVTDATLLSADLLKYATGQDLTNVKSVKEIQGAMIRFMTQMSSYSTQWIQTINSGAVNFTDGGGIRLGDDKTRLKSHAGVQNPGVEVVDSHMLLKASVALDVVGDEVIEEDVWITIRAKEQLDIDLDITLRHAGYAYSGIRNPTPYAKIRPQSLIERVTETDLDGLELYYIDPIVEPDPTDIPLNQIILARNLNGLIYPLWSRLIKLNLNGFIPPTGDQ